MDQIVLRQTAVAMGRKDHPRGVRGVRELLRRSHAPERLGPVAKQAEHEGNLVPMACTEASVE